MVENRVLVIERMPKLRASLVHKNLISNRKLTSKGDFSASMKSEHKIREELSKEGAQEPLQAIATSKIDDTIELHLSSFKRRNPRKRSR